MTCHNCKTLAQKFGWFISGSTRIQRYRCKQCGKTFGDIPERPLDALRTPPVDAARVIHLLCDGVVAHHNFCRVHRTLGETPAMAAGLTDHKWAIEELLKA